MYSRVLASICRNSSSQRLSGASFCRKTPNSSQLVFAISAHRHMATDPPRSKLSHEERTAHSLRDVAAHDVKITSIAHPNPTIRLIQLTPVDKNKSINFLPGQWLDVFVPGIQRAGGFTITSTPSDIAQQDGNGNGEPHLELAIQKSPNNPPAAWIWRSEREVLGESLTVRVGGEFTWPPPLEGKEGAHDWNASQIEQRNVVMVAGGVGINPIISMLTHIHRSRTPLGSLTVLYATKAAENPDGSDILFFPRIRDMVIATSKGNTVNRARLNVQMFVTGPSAGRLDETAVQVPTVRRRMEPRDIEAVIPGREQRRRTVCYICGPRSFTDELVAAVGGFDGMHPDRVLCEKWW